MMDVDPPSSSQLKTRTVARRFVADEFDSSSSMPELGVGDEFSSDSEPEQYPACLGDRSLEEVRTKNYLNMSASAANNRYFHSPVNQRGEEGDCRRSEVPRLDHSSRAP